MGRFGQKERTFTILERVMLFKIACIFLFTDNNPNVHQIVFKNIPVHHPNYTLNFVVSFNSVNSNTTTTVSNSTYEFYFVQVWVRQYVVCHSLVLLLIDDDYHLLGFKFSHPKYHFNRYWGVPTSGFALQQTTTNTSLTVHSRRSIY